MADDKFGFLDPNVPRELTAPEGYEDVHKPGMSWARQGDRKENTSWLTVAQYNHIVAQFRGLATLAGVDVSDLLASSPLLLRTFIQRTIEAVLSGVDLGDDYLVMRKQDYDTDKDGKVDLAAGGTGVSATSTTDLRGKLGITAAIDTAIQALGAVVVNKGSWNPSAGSFPGGGSAKNGWAYIATAAGTVGGVDFRTGDRALALADNASTATYAANWLKLDYTDQVLSVAGLTGAITAAALAAALTTLMPKTGGIFTGPTQHQAAPSPGNNLVAAIKASGAFGGVIGLVASGYNAGMWLTANVATGAADLNLGIPQQNAVAYGAAQFTFKSGSSPALSIGGNDALTTETGIPKTDLASTAAGKGAAMVGVEAISGVTGETVQAVLEALAAAITASSGIGVGQTWQDVFASRAQDTSYQNNTDKPIMVAISAGDSGSRSVQVSVNNSTWVTIATIGAFSKISFIVPAGHYYRLTSGGATSWAELR